MALQPSASEAELGNLGVAGRLAVVIDQLIAMVAAVGGSAGNTPRAGTNTAVVVAGNAVIGIAGPIRGGYITNPISADGQGLGAAENLYVDPVVAPGSTDGTVVGTTSILSPGQTFTIPSIAAGSQVRVNAASAGHKFNIVVW